MYLKKGMDCQTYNTDPTLSGFEILHDFSMTFQTVMHIFSILTILGSFS